MPMKPSTHGEVAHWQDYLISDALLWIEGAVNNIHYMVV